MMLLSNVIELREILNEYADKDINFSTAYKIMKIMELTDKDYQFYIDKTRELIDKYGRKDENGELVIEDNGSVKIEEQYITTVQEKMNEVMNIEVNIPSEYFLKLSDLEELKISCRKMKAFMPIITN